MQLNVTTRFGTEPPFNQPWYQITKGSPKTVQWKWQHH